MALLDGIANLGLGNKVIKGIVRVLMPLAIDVAILIGTGGLVLMIFFFTGLWIETGLGASGHVSHQMQFYGGYVGSLMITAFELHCWQIIEKAGGFRKALKKESLMILLFALVWALDAAASVGGFTRWITGTFYMDRLTPLHPNILFRILAPVVVAFTVLNIPIIASLLHKVREPDREGGGRKHRGGGMTSFDS